MSVVVGTPVAAAEAAPISYLTAQATMLPPQKPSKLERRDTIMNGLQQRCGWPRGLTAAFADSVEAFPLRFVVVDNSGSMQASDGKRLVPKQDGSLKSIGATRWAELTDACNEMADIASTLGAPTHFHLLNRVAAGQFFALGDDGSTMLGHRTDANYDLDAFKAATSSRPTGTTPLTEAVHKIASMIEPHQDKLRAHGQRVVVCLATDGLPNDSHTFLRALQDLQRLPVWLVVRLCTDEDNIVDYWNELDKKLEAPIETLDDLEAEAKEVHAVNPWLCYGPALHVARMMGMQSTLFDLLDEQAFVPSQCKEMIESVLGCGALPEPEVDFDAFISAVKRAQKAAGPVYNPLTRRMGGWIDMDKLYRRLGKGPEFCVIM